MSSCHRCRVIRATLLPLMLLVAAAQSTLWAQGAPTQSPPTIAARAEEMRDHFAQVARIHEALIRGDLKAVLVPAAELATTNPPEAFPAMAAPFVEEIRQSARRAGTAPNLRSAAASMTTLLEQCAGCHRAVGIFPSPASPRRADVSSVVGHMIEHQRAADDLLQGLMMPSASRWIEAADRLETATLKPSEWPQDRKLTVQARQADTTIHALAAATRTAVTSRERANVYVDLVTTCASCHSLHGGIWGPKSTR